MQSETSSCKTNSKVALAAKLVTLIVFLAFAERTIDVSKADTASPLSMPEEANTQETLSVAWTVIWVVVGIVFAGLTYYGFRKRRNMKRAIAGS